jgi:tetratricopeptide (TPR) repeat protein
VLADLVRTAEEHYDSRRALRWARLALEERPADPHLLHRAAELSLELDLLAEAARFTARFAAVAPPEEIAVVEDLRARLALDSGHGERAAAAARRAALLAPANPAPHLLLAEWRRTAPGARPDDVVLLCRRAVEAAPDDPQAQAHLGSALFEARRYDDAAPTLRRALTLAPRVLDGAPHLQLAQIDRRRGRPLEAAFHERRYRLLRAWKDEFVALLPALSNENRAGDLQRLGLVALHRHDPRTALLAFQEAARRTDASAAWRGVAAAQRRLGRFEEAVHAMRRASLREAAGVRR